MRRSYGNSAAPWCRDRTAEAHREVNVEPSVYTRAADPRADRCPLPVVCYPCRGGAAGNGQRPTDNGQHPQGGTPLLDRGLSCGKRSAWREGADCMQPETPVTPTATVMVNLGERSYPIDIGGGTL